jgi:hypothetical protein
MELAGVRPSWRIVEDVPESLGVAAGLRAVLGLTERFAPPQRRYTPPEAPAHDESSWQEWWSYLVTGRTPGAELRLPVDVARLVAGDRFDEARDWFAGRKIATARATLRMPITATGAWVRGVARRAFAGTLTVDVIPGDFLMAHQIEPRYWVLTLRSRLDDAAINDLVDAELAD